MQFETNDLNQCVGKSDGEHSRVTEKVDIEIRRIMTQIPVLAWQSGDAARKIFARVMERSSVEAKARITQHNVSRSFTTIEIVWNRTCLAHRDVDNSEELKNYKNEPFVVFDSGLGAIRVIAFSTARLLRRGRRENKVVEKELSTITSKKSWSGDGVRRDPRFQSLSGTAMNWRKKARQKPQIFWKHGIEQCAAILLLKTTLVLDSGSGFAVCEKNVASRSASNQSGERWFNETKAGRQAKVNPRKEYIEEL
uniref:Uncharacterized protein n=1 Tax=Ditylenchus dipsaci TaxID=166011 RepID=A0A915CT85_9BILA